MHGDDDHVAQDAVGLFVVPADQLIDGLDQLVRADDLGRVQAAVDPDDRLAFLRQRPRLLLAEAAGLVQLLRDLLVAIELREILGRGDDRGQVRAAFFGLADLDDLHPRGFLVELLPVGLELIVGGELVVVADVEAEMLLGGGNRLSGGRAATASRRRDRNRQRAKCACSILILLGGITA